jgi:hypothetical protein
MLAITAPSIFFVFPKKKIQLIKGVVSINCLTLSLTVTFCLVARPLSSQKKEGAMRKEGGKKQKAPTFMIENDSNLDLAPKKM